MAKPVLINEDGLEVTLQSGTSLDLGLPFENESDSMVAFQGRLGGPAASFATLERESLPLGPHAKGVMVARIVAPESGSHDLTVSVYDEDYLVEPPGVRTVTITVTPAAKPKLPKDSGGSVVADRPVVPPELEAPASIEQPSPTPAESAQPAVLDSVPAPAATPSPEPPAPAVATPTPNREGAATVPTEQASTESTPTEPAPSAAPHVVSTSTLEPPAPEPSVAQPFAPAPSVPEPSVTPKAKATVVKLKRDVPPEPTPAPEPPPEVTVKKKEPERPVVELGAPVSPVADRASAPVRRERPYTTSSYPKVLRSPNTGDVLELAPGTKALVLLEFENRGEDESTYVLMVKDDLRPTDDFAYARILVEQVNIRKGGKDELAFEISVPENAPPQTLRLRISHGRRDGGRDLEITRLTLKVSPRIAVGLKSTRERVVVGPLNRTPEFAFEVANEGNVDTAYRLSIKDASDSTAAALPGEFPTIESREPWRYLFDKEAEDVRQDGKVPGRLRLLRTGVWWLGWWETHRVKAVAVPVTDARNAERAGNDLDLVGTRWRLLPAPWFISVPAMLLFFTVFLGAFGVEDLKVDNAIPSDEGNLFVLQPRPTDYKANPSKPTVNMEARLSWSAPMLSWLKPLAFAEGARVERTGAYSAKVIQPVSEYGQPDHFRVASVIGLGGQETKRVVYLPLRTSALALKLEYADSEGRAREEFYRVKSAKDDSLHSVRFVQDGEEVPRTVNGSKVSAVEIVVNVAPSERIYITPVNQGIDNDVQVWRLVNPKDYEVVSLNKGSATSVYPNGRGKTWQILPRPGISRKGTDDFWFVTTDSNGQVVHVIINRLGGTF